MAITSAVHHPRQALVAAAVEVALITAHLVAAAHQDKEMPAEQALVESQDHSVSEVVVVAPVLVQ